MPYLQLGYGDSTSVVDGESITKPGRFDYDYTWVEVTDEEFERWQVVKAEYEEFMLKFQELSTEREDMLYPSRD